MGGATLRSRLIGPSRCRSVVSMGDLYCSMAASAAHITVTTAQGQVLQPPSLKSEAGAQLCPRWRRWELKMRTTYPTTLWGSLVPLF